MVAAMIQVQEVELEPAKARALAQALAEVQRHFNVVEVDPKWMALGALCVVSVNVYGPMVGPVMRRLKSSGARAGEPGAQTGTQAGETAPIVPGNVVPMTAQPQPTPWFSGGA